MNMIAQSGESYLPSSSYADPRFDPIARNFAAHQCLIAAALLMVIGTLLFVRAHRSYAAHVLIVVGIVEVFAFAGSA